MASSKNSEYQKTSFLSKSNSAFIEQMYLKFINRESDLPESWKKYFLEIGEEFEIIAKEINGPSWNPIKKKINLDLMKKGAKLLEGTHDFSTFRAASCSAKSPLRKIHPIRIKKVNEVIKIRISSKSFLQNQVRSMVGCLHYLSTYKWSYNDFKKAFKSKNGYSTVGRLRS